MEAVRKPRLRLGVFADSAQQSRWIVEAFARAGATAFAEIALVAIRPTPGRSQVPLLWRAYRRADRALFGSRSAWNTPQDLNKLVEPGRRVRMGSDRCAWKARIADARLDVAFALGDVTDAELEGMARYGTWRFCFGEAQDTFEPIAGMREAVEGRAVVASGLRIHLGNGRPDRLAQSTWARAYPFSVARSRDTVFAKSADIVTRALRDLHEGGARWLESGTVPAASQDAPRFPSTEGMLRDLSALGASVARRATERALTVEQWSIAYRFGDDTRFDGSLEGFHRLEPPKGGFWADPFPLQRDGRNYIFFEELPPGGDKAHISVVEVDREGGRWWMFANAAASGEEINDELHLFSAEKLMGEWTPHRRNPVKSDVRSSRPAGGLFRDGEGLFRPGQICTPFYGAGITLHRVTRLDEDEYHEEEERRIVPTDGATLGIHTLNRAGDLTVTDAFERRPRF